MSSSLVPQMRWPCTMAVTRCARISRRFRCHLDCYTNVVIVVAADNDRCEQGAALFPGPRPLDEDHPLMLAQKEDLQALGGVFLELIFSSLGSAGPSESTSGPALQRLLVDVFKGSIDEFRCVCAPVGTVL